MFDGNKKNQGSNSDTRSGIPYPTRDIKNTVQITVPYMVRTHTKRNSTHDRKEIEERKEN